MKILMIDTCGATGSVALADTGKQPEILARETLPGRSASERLVATIKELASRSGLSLESLDAMVVVHGPGSFTGVRVGLSAAKGLCEALNLPLVAISRLAVLAYLAETSAKGHIYPLLDAGRGEFYFGEYDGAICLREALQTRDQVLAAIEMDAAKSRVAAVAGTQSGWHAVTCDAEVAQSLATLSPVLLAEPTAEDALPLALARLHTEDFDDPAMLDANYLRRTDAEIFAKPTVRAASGSVA